MSEINKDIVKHTANLARIEISDDIAESFTSELDKIINYVHVMDELDLEDVEPQFHALNLTNVMREDIPEAPISKEDALKNAKQTESGQFKVPRML